MSILCVLMLFHWTGQNEVFPLRDAARYLFLADAETKSSPIQIGHEAYRALNEAAEPGARVFLFSYSRFWLRPDLIQTTNTASERDVTVVLDRKDPEKIWRQLNQHGFTYLLLDPATVPNRDPMSSIPPWVSIETLYRQDKWQVYRVRFDLAQERAWLATREVAPGAWEVVLAGRDSSARSNSATRLAIPGGG